jgi:hypothetical protein
MRENELRRFGVTFAKTLLGIPDDGPSARVASSFLIFTS